MATSYTPPLPNNAGGVPTMAPTTTASPAMLQPAPGPSWAPDFVPVTPSASQPPAMQQPAGTDIGSGWPHYSMAASHGYGNFPGFHAGGITSNTSMAMGAGPYVPVAAHPAPPLQQPWAFAPSLQQFRWPSPMSWSNSSMPWPMVGPHSNYNSWKK